MRIAPLSVAFFALFSPGCTYLIARSGQDLSELKTRDRVHERYGEPVKTGGIGGKPFEEFITHRKVADNQLAVNSVWAGMFTLGLSELIFVPFTTLDATGKAMLGQQLRFIFDESGEVTEVLGKRGRSLIHPYWYHPRTKEALPVDDELLESPHAPASSNLKQAPVPPSAVR